MGVVYTGRYRHISGVKNFAEIPVTVPPVQANETTWLDYPMFGSIGYSHSDVANNRMAVVTSNGTTGSFRGVTTFVYALNSQSVPSKLIAEVPSPNGVARAHVEFSPNGRYILIRHEFPREDLNLDQLEIYEVFEDRVEFKRSIDPVTTNIGREMFQWFSDSDHFIYRATAATGPSGNPYRVYIGSMTKPLMKVQVGSNSAYRPICAIGGTHDFLYEDFIGVPGNMPLTRVVGRLDPVAGTVSVVANQSGAFVQSASATLEYDGVGEGYVVKTFDGGTGVGVARDLYAYAGGTFVRIGALPAEMNGQMSLAASGDIIVTGVNSFTKLGYIQLATIGGAGVSLVSNVTHEGSSPGTVKGVHYNVSSNRINVIEDSGVRSYPMSANGFRLPRAPEEPRFFFDLNANTAPTKALYTLPAQVTTGNPAVKVIDGIPCMEFTANASVTQPWLNLLDFGIERGYVHFWFRWETLLASNNFFQFGPYVGRSPVSYSGTNANSNASVSVAGALGSVQRYKWNHILIAWDRGNVGVYFNGQREGYTTNATKRPVRDFNNKQFTIGGSASNNRVQFRDLKIHSGDLMGLMDNLEPAFLPPDWSQYRNNAAWPSLADGAMPIGQTPIITPKFS